MRLSSLMLGQLVLKAITQTRQEDAQTTRTAFYAILNLGNRGKVLKSLCYVKLLTILSQVVGIFLVYFAEETVQGQKPCKQKGTQSIAS